MSRPRSLTSADRTLPSWVTPSLLTLTVRVWSRWYGRPIDAAEAADILLRVGRLMDVLVSPVAARSRAEAGVRKSQ